MERTVCTGDVTCERLATECAFGGVNCKGKFIALWLFFAVHPGFLAFRHDRRHSSRGLARLIRLAPGLVELRL